MQLHDVVVDTVTTKRSAEEVRHTILKTRDATILALAVCLAVAIAAVSSGPVFAQYAPCSPGYSGAGSCYPSYNNPYNNQYNNPYNNQYGSPYYPSYGNQYNRPSYPYYPNYGNHYYSPYYPYYPNYGNHYYGPNYPYYGNHYYSPYYPYYPSYGNYNHRSHH
jgi:hypothetical protein